ncbi:hypothetical protein ACQR07_07425 [Bradyrhizobium sp. HKCCYLS20291]
MSIARRFASEMADVARMGVSRVSFTGGEPFLAGDQLAVMSEAAAAADIEATVVSACHWAKTRAAAERTVARFPGLTHWHLSTDLYHADHLDPEQVVHAALAVRQRGAKAHIRMAVARTPRPDERSLVDWIRQRLPDDLPITLQPISPVGRAREIGFTPERAGNTVPDSPCVTTGPLIAHDGVLLPCCSGLAERRDINPFATVDAGRIGLPAALLAWRGDPLLTLVRCLGFAYPAEWARDAGARLPTPAPSHPCDYCTALWSSPAARDAVRARASQPAARDKVEALAAALFSSDDADQDHRSEGAAQ